MWRKRPKSACAIGALIVISVQGAIGSLHADARRYVSTVTPLLDTAGGKTIGSLQPGSPLDVIGQSGAATHVALHGWSVRGAKATILASPDRHIVLLSGYTGEAKPSTSQTLAGKVYEQVTIDGWAVNSALVDDIRTVWKSAGDLLAQKCGSCHALPAPNSLTVNQWPAIMKTQAVNAGLDSNQAALLTAYLQAQSGR